MALTAQQIVTLACQISKCPGFTSQAGQKLNAILRDLCQNYDLELARLTTTFAFTTSSGPYAMPADYLRSRKGMVFYMYNGIPYSMVPIDISEYDMLVQQAGFNDFPRDFTTDMAVSPPNMFVWPPPSIPGIIVTVRYYAQKPDITSPESSLALPWFPNDNYLITRLAGELMQLTGDDRVEKFLGDDPDTAPLGAGTLLRRYLQMKDDPEGKTNTVKLDRRLFGTSFSRLPNSKIVGWGLLLSLLDGTLLWHLLGAVPWIS